MTLLMFLQLQIARFRNAKPKPDILQSLDDPHDQWVRGYTACLNDLLEVYGVIPESQDLGTIESWKYIRETWLPGQPGMGRAA